MDLKLKGKRAAVFGASMGLGRGIAEALIKEGVKVAIVARNEDTLKQTQKEIGAALALTGDTSKPGNSKSVVEKVIQEFGGLDILVCNTGGPSKGIFTELSEEQWRDGFQNLWMSPVEAMQACIPTMKKQKWGRVLFVTSIAAKEPLPLLTVSNGMRAGLLGLTKSLSHEYGPDGITFNAVLPGHTRTDRMRQLGVDEKAIAATIPVRRLGEPWELGALTAFLASDLAGFITGQTIACDGGYLRGI